MTVSERIFDLLKSKKKARRPRAGIKRAPDNGFGVENGETRAVGCLLCKNRRIFRRIARLSYYGATTTRRARTTNNRQQ